MIKLGLLLILLCLSCASCVPVDNPAVAVNMFHDSDCLSSCWLGLRPGQSAVEVENFYKSTLSDYETIESDGFTFFIATTRGTYSAQSYVFDDRLIGIMLVTGTSQGFDLTLEQILQTLGEPQYYFVSAATSVESTTFFEPFIYLYYPEDGYIFHLEIESPHTHDFENIPCLTLQDPVNRIDIVQPNDITQVVIDAGYATVPRPSTETANAFAANLPTWTEYPCAENLAPS